MRIGLKQNQHTFTGAEAMLIGLSDPTPKNYGKFWTQAEVIDAFKPSEETMRNVTDWPQAEGITDLTHSDNKLWIAFDASAASAESFMRAEFWACTLSDGTIHAVCDMYHLPASVSPHVDYVTPGVKESDITHRHSARSLPQQHSNSLQHGSIDHRLTEDATLESIDPDSLEHCNRLVTPACIRALYNFSSPDPNDSVSPTNSMGIFAAGKLS
jgi:tripeptidyl-peptidase-1